MSAKHTPGPWFVRGNGYDTAEYVMARDVLVRGGADERIIAKCESYGPRDRISRLYNAHLIAAAPDLLEASMDMVMHVNATQVPAEVIDAMRAAIAKAEGQE